MKNILHILLISWLITAPDISCQDGMVCVPVADLLGQSMKSVLEHNGKTKISSADIAAAYKELPTSSEKHDLSCPRIYQLLYNERVRVLSENGPEVKIEVPSALYGCGKEAQLCGTYWTLKDYIATKKVLGENNFDRIVPQGFKLGDTTTIVLEEPFYHEPTGVHFSAGTKFVVKEITPKKDYQVMLFHPKTQKAGVITVPGNLSRLAPATQYEAQRRFITLLKKWARASASSPIVYVWGGASYTRNPNIAIQHGFDCAGLIIRAAQSCHIPFYLKNSSAQLNHLEELLGTKLEEGDIIWIPGHVMIVSDLKNNLLLESRGYTSGFGKLQEIALNEVFKNMNTYQELLAAYKKKQPLELLNKQKEVSSRVPTYKILKFSSVWQNHHKHTPTIQ